MRNRKLNELCVLRVPVDTKVLLQSLAVPKPIFVGMPREKFTVDLTSLTYLSHKNPSGFITGDLQVTYEADERHISHKNDLKYDSIVFGVQDAL